MAFYSACASELTTNPNPDVLRTYDVLYALIPFIQAVCTKDDNANYCVTDIIIPSSSTTAIGASNAKRAANQTPVVMPNVTTFRQTNLLFFFLQPQTSSTTLCTTCTRNVIMSYISFEQSVPYAPGIGNSPLMGGQIDLYNAITNTCGQSFFGGAAQAAGEIHSGLLGTSAAPRSVSKAFGGILTAVMGIVVLDFAAIL